MEAISRSAGLPHTPVARGWWARVSRAIVLGGGAVLSTALALGCAGKSCVLNDADCTQYGYLAPDEYVSTEPAAHETIAHVPAPLQANSHVEPEYWNVSLEETVRIALQNSELLRDLGGTVLRAPDTMVTRYRASLQYSDPRFGVEGALSEFDAQFQATATFEQNDRAFNNQFFGGGTNIFEQDLNVYTTELSKTAATGSQFSARTLTNYDANNASANRFSTAWDAIAELEMRQPLWRGAGVHYNRIAGPNASEGEANGVLIARVNTEISETEFELAIRDYVSNVENAYWDLYFAYRDLESKKAARDAAYQVWQKIEKNRKQERRGSEIDKAQAALEQYYRFQDQVETALTGKLFERTQNRNGAPGGSLRGIGGIHVAERRLRLLIGVPINDCLLMRPADEPPVQEIAFDWDGLLLESMSRRSELRQQKLRVRRREMELFASRNFLKPQLDAIGLYRFRGFGKDLLDQHSDATFAAAQGTNSIDFKNAVENLVEGDFQEWQLGLELTVPIGFRKANAAVQNSEFALARERTVLHEQERQVVHDLSNALGEVSRAHQSLRTQYNRRAVSRELVATLEKLLNEDRQVDFDRVLDAQRRLSESNSAYYLALAEYAIALKNVNFERGSLLDHHDLLLADRVIEAGIVGEDVAPLGPLLTPVPQTPDDLPENSREMTPMDGPLPIIPPAPGGGDDTTDGADDAGITRLRPVEIGIRTVSAEQPEDADRHLFEKRALAELPSDVNPRRAGITRAGGFNRPNRDWESADVDGTEMP